MIDLEKIYLKFPKFLQELFVILQGYRINKKRYSGNYDKIYREVIKQEELTGELLTKFQSEKLKIILESANRIPFWNERFLKFGVEMGAKDLVNEIKKLPILTKQELKENKKDLELGKTLFQGQIEKIHTSGTTGSGFKFWRTFESEKIQWATWWRYRSWHGINRNVWSGYFGGRQVIPAGKWDKGIHRVNQSGKQIVFSSYHLNEDTVEDYIKVLKRYKIKWIHGYPSMITLLCNLIQKSKVSANLEIETISFGSENLLDYQKKTIVASFPKAKLIDHYGLSEGVANISMDKNSIYTVDEDFSLVEFVPIEEVTDSYKIIGTNLTNPAFPLIRYDTNDTASGISKNEKGWRTVRQIDGRLEDYIVLPNGTKIGRMDHIFKDMIQVKEAQIVQNNKKAITINVVWNDINNIESSQEMLIKETRKRLGDEIIVEINSVSNIPRTKSGKLRFVINNIRGNATNL